MFFYKLSKKLTRKNLYSLMEESFNEILNNGKKNKVLNIGSGGEVIKIIKKKFDDIYEIDIDPKREPDQVIDACQDNLTNKVNYKPNIVCAIEVLEHTSDPKKFVDNIYCMLNSGDYFIASVPFIFAIHDEPHDYFRFTKYGLKLLFKEFSTVEIYQRNGWLEATFNIFVRLRFEKNFLSKIFGNIFVLIAYILAPFFILLQKIFPSNKITTGYFIKAIK